MRRRLVSLLVLGGLHPAVTEASESPAVEQTAKLEMVLLKQLSYEAMMRTQIDAWADYLVSEDGEQQKMRVTLVERSSKRLAIEADSMTWGPDGQEVSFGKGDRVGEHVGRVPVGMVQMSDAQGIHIELIAQGKDGGSLFVAECGTRNPHRSADR
jgi:hypothetical protein